VCVWFSIVLKTEALFWTMAKIVNEVVKFFVEEFMMKKVMILFLVLAICGMAQAELLSGNRGFEYGDMTDWLQWGSGSSYGWQSWYDTTTVINDGTAYEGDYYVELGQSHAGWWGYNVIWQGESTVIPGDPCETYTLSAWFRSTDATSTIIKFEASDGDWVNNKWEQERNPSIVADGTWQFLSESFVAPAGTTELRAVVGSNAGNFTMDIDDVSFVPEPMSIALLGLGSAFVLRRRRKA